MKSKRFVIAIGLWLVQSVSATVYTPGVSVSSPSAATSNLYTSTGPVTRFGAWFDVTINSGLAMNPVPGSYTLGIGQEWFPVSEGTAVDHVFVTSHTPFASSLRTNLSGPILLDYDDPFLLGFWLHIGGIPETDLLDTYGWAKLQYTHAGLTLLDSAIEDSRQGIFAGTTTVVPEPSTFALSSVTVAILAALRRSSSNARRNGHVSRR